MTGPIEPREHSDIKTRLWERAEAAIFSIARDYRLPIRQMTKAATAAVLRELSDEVYVAEEDDNTEWPGSWDLEQLADALEEMTDGN